LRDSSQETFKEKDRIAAALFRFGKQARITYLSGKRGCRPEQSATLFVDAEIE
jgi:hypothetical protein